MLYTVIEKKSTPPARIQALQRWMSAEAGADGKSRDRKTMEKYGKTLGKRWENHGKYEKTMGHMGKLLENIGKDRKNQINTWCIAGKIW